MATRRTELGPPRHSTHALAAIVKRLKSSTSVFFRAEITERALMWNRPPLIAYIFSTLLPPPLTKRLHFRGSGSNCEALITPRLHGFKKKVSLEVPVFLPRYRSGSTFLAPVRFQIRRIAKASANNPNVLEAPIANSSIRSGAWHRGRPALAESKGRLFRARIKWKALWAFVEKREMTLSLGNPDITGRTLCSGRAPVAQGAKFFSFFLF